ncbi:MAG: hypothetical protein RLZ35_1266 [Pseudomonadota bacterium]
MVADFDILIVGSGPSGVMAAEGSLPTGLRVGMLDAGYVSDLEPLPSVPFATLKQSPAMQATLLQQAGTTKAVMKTGAHLTPFRAHTIRDTQDRLPIDSTDFFPLQSLAKGGLSVAWGAATFTYTDAELKKMGLEPLASYYEKVAKKIGLSGPVSSPICAVQDKQVPLHMDDNAKKIWQHYDKNRPWFKRKGFYLEPATIAALSEPYDDREPHPHYDTDFWNNPGNSVFRADFWVDKLIARYPGFRYLPNRLVQRFTVDKKTGLVTVLFVDLKTGQSSALTAKKLLLCAGAINSYRIAALSLGHIRQKNPLLCNPYQMMSFIHLPMLGRKAGDKRYSLAQLFALFQPDPQKEPLSLQFYSYRSLLLYRLIEQTPLPTWAARLWWRALVESMVIVGVHYPTDFQPDNWIQVNSPSTPTGALATLSIGYKKSRLPMPLTLSRLLLGLRCVPMTMVNAEPGGSIHYAGTLPMVHSAQIGAGLSGFTTALTTTPQAALSTCPNVHVLDGSTWRYLPAKGLTFTLMANSLRLSEKIANALKEGRTD